MKFNNRSFNQILQKEREPNMQALMIRARTANRIAKSASIKSTKLRAYKVKHKTLQGLKRFFPKDVVIEQDFYQDSGILLVTIPEQGFGLHAPAEKLALEA